MSSEQMKLILADITRMGEWQTRFDPDEGEVEIYVDDGDNRTCPIAAVGGQQADEGDDGEEYLDQDTTSARFAGLIRSAPAMYQSLVEVESALGELLRGENGRKDLEAIGDALPKEVWDMLDALYRSASEAVSDAEREVD